MEDRPYISFWRWVKETNPLWSVIIVSAFVRFYYSYHPLISDEVFNLTTIKQIVRGEGFGDYFFRHPPLYLLISSLVSYVVGDYPQGPAYISIIFSLLSLIPLYKIAEYIFDKNTALWTVVFVSVMPASISYSGWIKQDAMLLFFFLWGLIFYLNERHYLCGVIIGIALLVKEFAFFFFPLTFLITAVVEKREGNNKPKFKWAGWLKMAAVASIIALWWYILFGSTFYQVTGDALVGGNIRELGWHFPWWFYIKNIPYDLSRPLIVLSVIGGIFLIKGISSHSIYSKYMIPILWIVVFYLPLSLMTVKAPWYIYLSTPPIAMVAGFGVVNVIYVSQIKGFRVLLYLGLMAALVFVIYRYDNVSFIKQVRGITGIDNFSKIQGEDWDEMIEKKKFWSQKIREKEKVAFIEYKPILPYLMDIENSHVLVLKVSQFMAFSKKDLMDFAINNNIGIFVLNIESLTYTERNLQDMTSLWGEPEKITPLLIFRTKY